MEGLKMADIAALYDVVFVSDPTDDLADALIDSWELVDPSDDDSDIEVDYSLKELIEELDVDFPYDEIKDLDIDFDFDSDRDLELGSDCESLDSEPSVSYYMSSPSLPIEIQIEPTDLDFDRDLDLDIVCDVELSDADGGSVDSGSSTSPQSHPIAIDVESSDQVSEVQNEAKVEKEEDDDDEDDDDDDDDGGFDLDDELVPKSVSDKFWRQRMRKLGTRMNKSKRSAYHQNRPGCVYGKHGLGLKHNI